MQHSKKMADMGHSKVVVCVISNLVGVQESMSIIYYFIIPNLELYENESEDM